MTSSFQEARNLHLNNTVQSLNDLNTINPLLSPTSQISPPPPFQREKVIKPPPPPSSTLFLHHQINKW